MIQEQLIYKKVGHVLWDIARVETGAASAFGMLARLPYLTPADQKFLRERVMPEERGHDDMMSKWAERWAGPAPQRQMPYSACVWRDLVAAARLDDEAKMAFVLATIHWNETNTLRSKQLVLGVLERIDAGVRADFQQLADEERGHVAWQEDLLRRLEVSHPKIVKMFSRYREYTSLVYPALVNRSHSDAWRWVAERLK